MGVCCSAAGVTRRDTADHQVRSYGMEEMRCLLLLTVAAASQSQPAPAPDSSGACGEGSDCLNGGVCASGSCVCVAGFSGSRCEVSPDRCQWPAPVHCAGSARCVDGECVRPEPCGDISCGDHGSCAEGVCVCDSGWAGGDCLDVDECASQPCYNGGGCFHSGDVAERDASSLGSAWSGQFVCSCASGFSGDRCQCPDCGDHGSCQPESGLCLCVAGYAGLSCEFDINDCHSAPCQHGSTCIDGVDSYECVCMPGFGGPSCDENIDECASAPCRNGGTCEDLVEGYTCTCLDTFAGTECEISMDACYSAPCANDGECALADSGDGFLCRCTDGFEGSRCDHNIDDCASQPCANGARCVDTTGGFSCDCTAGWSGPLCVVHVCEQTTYSLCGNGDCTRDTSALGYSCTCNDGWRGQHCEQRPDPCQWPVVVQCGAHGRCHSGGCACSDGHTGAHCERAPNLCLWPTPIDCKYQDFGAVDPHTTNSSLKLTACASRLAQVVHMACANMDLASARQAGQGIDARSRRHGDLSGSYLLLRPRRLEMAKSR